MTGDSLAAAMQNTANYSRTGTEQRAKVRTLIAGLPDADDLASMLGLDDPEFEPGNDVAHSFRHYRGQIAVSGRALGHMS